MLRSNCTCVQPLLEAEEELLQWWYVLWLSAAGSETLTYQIYTGHRTQEILVKEERMSLGPSAPKRQKTCSTTDANGIVQMDPIDVDIDPPKAIGKCRKTC